MTREQAQQQVEQLENASKLLSVELEMSRRKLTAFARKSENEILLADAIARQILVLDETPEGRARADVLNQFLNDHREFAQAELDLMELGITKLESSIAVQKAMAEELRKQLGASRLAVPGMPLRS